MRRSTTLFKGKKPALPGLLESAVVTWGFQAQQEQPGQSGGKANIVEYKRGRAMSAGSLSEASTFA